MRRSLGKSINILFKSKNNNENTAKTLKKDSLYENKEKLNFRKSRNFTPSYGKRHKKTNEIVKKNILKNNKDNTNDSFSDNEKSSSGTSKYFTGKRYNYKCKVNSNKDIRNIIENNLTPTKNNEVAKLDINYNTDKINYFKYRRKGSKSSRIGKKFNNIYKDIVIKKNNILNKKKESVIQNTFSINNLQINNTLNTKTNSLSRNNKENLFQIQPYKRKNIFNNNNKLKNKNYIKGNHNLYLFSEENSLLSHNQKISKIPNINLINKGQSKKNFNLFNTSYSSFHQDTDEPKKKSLFLNLPSIKSDDIQKTLNIKTERNSRPVIPISKFFSKTKKNLEEEIKKTTTINIYNNKINNINNIILNEKNQIYDNKREENNFSSILLDSDNLNNKGSKKEKKMNLSKKIENSKNKDKIKEKLYEGLKNYKNNEDASIPISFTKEKLLKINRNKQKTINLEISKDNKSHKNKPKDKKYTRLFEKLSINYKNNFLTQSNISRHEGESMDEMEIYIKQKVLNAFSLKKNSKFNNKLIKIKKETTIKLFEKLTKKIYNDIEEKSKHYKQKEKINFGQNDIIKIEKDYISKVNRQSKKLIKILNKYINPWKNLLNQIYKTNISEYTKITPDRNKIFFFKYIFDDYFTYIDKIFSLDTNYKKRFKKYNLSNIYNININNCSIRSRSSAYKRNRNYFHSLFFQNIFIEKDKIQIFSTNERYFEKAINQINSLIQQAKNEISNRRKTGDLKLDFIVKEKEKDNENEEGSKHELTPKNHNNNFAKRTDIKRFTFFSKRKSEFFMDKNDTKNRNGKKNMHIGKNNFNYKSRNSFNDKDKNLSGDADNNSKCINSSSKLFSILNKRKSVNHDLSHSHYTNKKNTKSNFDCKSLDNKKETLEGKYNITVNNREKIERKYDKIITRNNSYFYKRKINTKTRKKEKNNEIKKSEINILKGHYMFKNMIDFRTDEIKLNIKNNIKSPVEMLFYHIKEHDFDDFVELFERKQIDLNSRNRDNDSFLIYAVKCKAMKFVLYLVKRGIDVNLENKLGNTALHYAFSDQNFQLADVLLEHGADEFRTNVYGKTPWECLGKKNI